MGFYGSNGTKMDALTSDIFRSNKTNGKLDGKKIKEVYPTLASLCHAWASENVFRGRSGCSMFFESGIIYSYGHHYKAAKIHTGKNGKLVLVNSKDYSVSTGNHLSEIYSATKHLRNLRVPDVDPENKEDHKRNLDYLNEQLIEVLESIYKMKGYYSLESLEVRVAIINNYCHFFGLKDDLTLDAETLALAKACIKTREVKRDSRDAKRKVNEELKTVQLQADNKVELDMMRKNFPALLEKWENYEIDEVELQKGAVKYIQITGPFGRVKNQSLMIELNAYEERIEKVFKKIKLESIEEFKSGKKAAWLIRTRFSLGHLNFNFDDEFALLRVKDNKVETSEGADVPLDHAIRLLNMVLKSDTKKGERVGLYTLEDIKNDPKGDKTIVIGCHKILLSEAVAVLKPYMNDTKLALVK